MASGKPTEDKVLSNAAAVLGIKAGEDLTRLDRKGLQGFTQRQLFECAKRLNLKGVSKLSKDELSLRVASEFANRRAPSAADAGSEKPPSPAASAMPAAGDKALPAAGDGADSSWSHKFEVREHAAAEQPGTIPWSYGNDRVTGMAVDPDRLFVYWEVTDDAIARARADLGKAGKDAWLNLRIYDTTDRIFDGTNAHAYFDHRVERGDRHWFFHIGKPSSSAFIDIGLKSNEGYFAKIVRSGRVEFARREPAPWAEPEWLSVRSLMGSIELAGRGQHLRRQAPGIAPTTPADVPSPGPRRHVALLAVGGILHHRGGWPQGNPRMGRAHDRRHHRVPSRNHLGKPGHGFRLGGGAVQLSGFRPGAGTRGLRGALARLPRGRTNAHRARSMAGRDQRVSAPTTAAASSRAGRFIDPGSPKRKAEAPGGVTAEHAIPGSSERLLTGASERRWRYASEMRLGGASEVFFLGASEYRARGASERLFIGASQYKMRGASERRFAGGSEVRMRGASERMLAGASELRLGGASERRLGGASELQPGGASERNLGGGSEGRLAMGQVDDVPASGGDGHYPAPESIGQAPKHKE